MTSRIMPVVLLASILTISACGSAETATTATTTTAAPATETTAVPPESTTPTPASSTQPPASSCPDVPVPDEVTSTAPVPFDGDGDGEPDTLTTFQSDGKWWIGVEWAAGGSGWIPLQDDDTMAVNALGGYDLDGDGTDEAFISLTGPASGLIVQVFQQDQCGLKPINVGNDVQFTFPVTGTIGTFSSATCEDGNGITVINGTIGDAGTIDLERVTYHYDPEAQTMAYVDDTDDTADSAELSSLTGLRCGDLDDALTSTD